MTRHTIVHIRVLSLTARRAIDQVRRLGARWAPLGRTLALWRHRRRTRAELHLIAGHQLNDLPFDTSTILHERGKAFWEE